MAELSFKHGRVGSQGFTLQETHLQAVFMERMFLQATVCWNQYVQENQQASTHLSGSQNVNSLGLQHLKHL
jgi:hypothetical protein